MATLHTPTRKGTGISFPPAITRAPHAMDDDTTALDELGNILRYSGPVALVNLCQYMMHIIDLAVIGQTLGSQSLAAACLCLVVANLTQEPACFIVANAMTTLCTDAFHARASAYISSAYAPVDYLKGAFLFCLLLSLPVGALMFFTPAMLSVLHLPSSVLAAARAYAPWYALTVTPALLQSMLLGFLRAQRRLQSTATVCVATVCCNLVLALLLVPKFGLCGSVGATTATRYFSVGLLVFFHRSSLPLTLLQLLRDAAQQASHALGCLGSAISQWAARVSPTAAPSGRTAAVADERQPPLQVIGALYVASVLPGTLRIGGFQLLTLLAYPLSADPNESVAVALTTREP